ncbi:MAG TPA: DUF58 domain-containing protein [Thermoleophilaceae bacterium]|nr:DUF58 domain-containing protein [Thermoleophilaceae bacterium]
MTTVASVRLRAYASLTALALVAVLAGGPPELAALAVPFLALVAAGLAGAASLGVDGTLRLGQERALEGERVAATVTIRNAGPAARVEVRLPTTARLATDPTPFAFWLPRGGERDIGLELSAGHWGVQGAGPAVVRARDRLGAFAVEGPLGGSSELRVYPSEENLSTLIAPLRTRPVVGSQVSGERGEGIEFADLRPLAPGDRVRSINWRATSRRRVPHVNVQHPEHGADMVLFLDTFAEAEHENEGTLDAAVQAAAALASAYLTQRDRVALVSFGGELSWLAPAAGTRQLYRIVDALLLSDVSLSTSWKDVAQLPRRLLPPRALVLALSPLLDERGVDALLDLRARGYDLALVEVSPVAHSPIAHAESRRPVLRLWQLRRDTIRARFEALGVPVARWEHPDVPLALAVEEVISFRRHTRPVSRA